MALHVKKLKDLLVELRCMQCSKLLSVLPVYHCAAIGNVCGRCAPSLNWMIENGTLERAPAYEAVAKYLRFPCSNSEAGCPAELKVNEVEEHERSCSQNVFPCPLNVPTDDVLPKCAWQGRMHELVPHLRSSHEDCVRTDSVSDTINIHESSIHAFITTISEHTFVVFVKYIQPIQKFYCVVMCCAPEPESQFYRYQLQLGKEDSFFMILRKNGSAAYGDLNKIIEENCNVIVVDLPSITKILGNPTPTIHYKVGILKKAKKEMTDLVEKLKITTSKVPEAAGSLTNITKAVTASPVAEKQKIPKCLSEMDKQLLEELECPICNNYMVPPIYICLTGHSFCLHCKSKMKDCPTCRMPLGDIRNYTLEKLTSRVQYPCKYNIAGCTVICSSQQVYEHENICTYGKKRCPLKMLPAQCSVQNITGDLIDHILKTHKSELVEENCDYARNIKATITTTYHLTIHEREVFFVCCKHSQATGPMKFNFVHFGMHDSHPRYRYELEFIDQAGSGLKLIVSQLCQPVPSHINLALKNCLTLPLDLLEPFINKRNEPMLYFKFRLEKI